ncbi:hypothetical protein [Agrobacterium sp. B1(2019)]|uniref:hypothetical protein n=1 Tax=Agrobacterium sp. B1(2019) TaxID=2607032 RepID=UPI0011EFEB87|nr:hypothetical protein [Agrobacterium sp. B1(2019)]TZG36040.1 hypothetical protein AGR1_00410 [Agrobacterium sp. B1(2019)]
MRERQSEEQGRPTHQQKSDRHLEQKLSFQVPDFELHKHGDDGWKIFAVSDRDIHWIAANFSEWSSGETLLTLQEANKFLREARKFSLCTSYKRLNGKTIL